MKIMTVVGARPNFMKAGPIISGINDYNEWASADTTGQDVAISHVLVHTGQHYDSAMSDSFFAELGLPTPDVYLGVGSGSHAAQTADIMRKFEPIVVEERPDVVVVVGDVNSTVGCALVAAKLIYDPSHTRPLLAHVEAGLRSFDRGMPEEINRIVTDHLSDLLFVTEESGLTNLRNEGICAEKIHLVGNTMIDSLLTFRGAAENSTILERLHLGNGRGDGTGIAPYALLTLHRPRNVDNRGAFVQILSGLKELSSQVPVVFPVHPRTRRRILEFDLGPLLGTAARDDGSGGPVNGIRSPGFLLVDPLGYLDFVGLMMHARLVVTDSGGIQEETTCLGVPCITVRDNTERPATVETGTNIIAGTSTEGIRSAVHHQLRQPRRGGIPLYWDGKAAERIIHIIVGTLAGGVRPREVMAPSSSG